MQLSEVRWITAEGGSAFNSTGFGPLLINLLNWGNQVWVRQNGSTTSIPPFFLDYFGQNLYSEAY